MNEERFLQALEEGDIEHAEKILGSMGKSIPRTRILYFEGMVLDAIGEPEEALKKFNMALVLHLSDPSIWLAKARVLQEMGRMDMARRSVDRACRLSSTNPAACLLYADILYKMKDHKGAMRYVDEAMEMAPADPEILTLKGILVSILEEDYIKALSFFDKALETDEDYANAWTNRGVALRMIGDRDGAIYSFQKALMLDENEKVAKKMLEHMGADDYIIPRRKGKKKRTSRRRRYMIDDAPRERKVKRMEREYEDTPEEEADDGIEEMEDEEDMQTSEDIEDIDDAWEEDLDGAEGGFLEVDLDAEDEEPTEDIEDILEDADEWEDVDELHEELEDLDEEEMVDEPVIVPPPPKKKVKKKKTKKIHLKCPRCDVSFDLEVKGRTEFSCPSCGLSGQIE